MQCTEALAVTQRLRTIVRTERLLTLQRAPWSVMPAHRTMLDGACSPRASYHTRSSSAEHQPPSVRHELWHTRRSS